jgi:hypothetical protein
MNDFLKDDNYESDSEIAKETFNLRISKERIEFLNLIEISNLKSKDFCHTANFWLKNQIKFPYLTRLALIFHCLPASSAYIERFYSICGNVCRTRAGNMNSQTIINRSVLKANLEILMDLSETQIDF